MPRHTILTEARVVVDLRHQYNPSRLHGKLGYTSPERFAAQHTRLTSFVEARQNYPTQLRTKHPLDSLSN